MAHQAVPAVLGLLLVQEEAPVDGHAARLREHRHEHAPQHHREHQVEQHQRRRLEGGAQQHHVLHHEDVVVEGNEQHHREEVRRQQPFAIELQHHDII